MLNQDLVQTDAFGVSAGSAYVPHHVAFDDRVDRARQHMDAVYPSSDRAALVQLAQRRVSFTGAWRAISGTPDWLPFLLATMLLLLVFLGLGISLWPYAATLWQAASSPPTLAFVGAGTTTIVPLVLAYFAFAYWVFRGKTTDQSGYGE